MMEEAPFRRGRILADPMGFGKTAQLIAAARLRREKNASLHRTTVTVCPAMAIDDWRKEVARVWPESSVWELGLEDRKLGADERRAKLRSLLLDQHEHEHLFVLSSYELAQRVYDAAIDRENALLGTTIIDEAHYLKNTGTRRANVGRPIIGLSELSGLSTGTPIFNRPIDLYNLLDLCAPGKFGGLWRFAKRYFNIEVARGGFGQNIGRLLDKEGLSEAIKDYVICRTVQEAYGELPPCIDKLVPVEAKGGKIHLPKAPRDGDAASKALRDTVQAKLPTVVQLALELDEPLVIYVYEKAHAHALAEKLTAKEVSVLLATGDDARRKRSKVVDQWKAGAARVLICTMGAVRESATLTRASAMIFADLDWTLAVMGQCRGRIHPSRQPEGNRRPARYYYVVTRWGYDAAVAERLVEKFQDAEGVIGKDANAAALNGVLRQALPPAETAQEAIDDLARRIEARAKRLEGLI